MFPVHIHGTKTRWLTVIAFAFASSCAADATAQRSNHGTPTLSNFDFAGQEAAEVEVGETMLPPISRLDVEEAESESDVVAEPVGIGMSVVEATTRLADRGEWWKPLVRRPQRSTPRSLNVSLNALLVGALAHSAHVQVISDEPLISETQINAADAAFDWTSFLEARWDDISEPVGSTLTTGNASDRFQDHIASVEFGVRRRNTMGGEFEVGQRFGHQNNNSVFFVPNNQGTARLTLSYTQPLLRGAGRVYNTSLTVLAKLNSGEAQLEFERKLQNHLLELTRAYWNLYFERGTLLQKQRLLQRGIEIQDELQSRRDIDALQSQIVRADAAVESRRAELVRARLTIRTAEARIRALVNDPNLGDTLSSELVPREDLSEAPPVVDLQSAIAQAMQWRPEVGAAVRQVKAACVRMAMSKREALPLLNVILETYAAGLEGNSSVGEAYTNQFTEGAPSYGAGLQYEYPIWNRAAHAKLQKRRLEVRRLQNQFRSTIETLKLEVEVAVHKVTAAYEALQAKRRAMEAAAREVEYLRDRWSLLPIDNGSASLLLEDLLDAQERLTEAEFGMLRASLEFTLSQVGYKRVTGTLLQHNHIEFDRNCNCNMPQQRAVQTAAPYEVEPQPLTTESTGSIKSLAVPLDSSSMHAKHRFELADPRELPAWKPTSSSPPLSSVE